LIEIRPLKSEDCFSVAKAHITCLNTPFKGNAGIHLLKTYYDVIASQKGGIGFIAIKDGEFAGFVCGIWDHELIRKTLMKNWIRLVIYAIEQALYVPKIITGLVRRVINPYAADTTKLEGYELRPIVVLPGHRGQGIAGKLTLHLLEDAKQRGFEQVFLLTEVDNFVAAKFYTKFGFTFERQVDRAGNAMKLFCYRFSIKGL